MTYVNMRFFFVNISSIYEIFNRRDKNQEVNNNCTEFKRMSKKKKRNVYLFEYRNFDEKQIQSNFLYTIRDSDKRKHKTTLYTFS